MNRAWENVLTLDCCPDEEGRAQPLLDRAVNQCPSRCVGFEGLGAASERIAASLERTVLGQRWDSFGPCP